MTDALGVALLVASALGCPAMMLIARKRGLQLSCCVSRGADDRAAVSRRGRRELDLELERRHRDAAVGEGEPQDQTRSR